MYNVLSLHYMYMYCMYTCTQGSDGTYRVSLRIVKAGCQLGRPSLERLCKGKGLSPDKQGACNSNSVLTYNFLESLVIVDTS